MNPQSVKGVSSSFCSEKRWTSDQTKREKGKEKVNTTLYVYIYCIMTELVKIHMSSPCSSGGCNTLVLAASRGLEK